MKRTALEHLAAFLVVVLLSLVSLSLIHSYQDTARTETIRLIAPYLSLGSLDLTDPIQVALFKETLLTFYPNEPSRVDSIVAALDSYTVSMLTDPNWNGRQAGRGLTTHRIGRLAWMYVRFIAVFTIVVALTYFGARTTAVYRFIKMKEGKDSSLRLLAAVVSRWRSGSPPPTGVRQLLELSGRALLKGIASLILFSPAYVIAYAFKTEFDTSSVLFMVLLAVASNGVLMNLTRTFYTFLVHESRKGYVETAKVKGLDSAYELPSHPIRMLAALLRPMNAFSGHVFKHIYMNASFQFIPAVKEQVAFLITGLIIIEMALNIHGHLCYELLRSLLASDYDAAFAIGVSLFFAVKITEALADGWHARQTRRYLNVV